ncbi:MAG: hypothetical protein GWP08_06880 [Nitrospiraceae bacterium]|nr:hypothetical protein [Nitrospiraceae bacterium]
MALRSRLRVSLAVALFLGVPLALFAVEDGASPVFHIVTPVDRCVVNREKLEIVVLDRRPDTPALRVNGQPIEWKPYTPPLYAAQAALIEGENTIEIGGRTISLFRTSDGATPPKDWPEFKAHRAKNAGWRDCSLCHETAQKDERVRVGEWKGYDDTCASCHDEDNVTETHAHTLDPLADCGSCHAFHGTTRDTLLRGEPRKLCAGCHD